MHSIETMMKSHPAPISDVIGVPAVTAVIAEAVEIMERCASICAACADACLGEEAVDGMRDCIRTDLDCADVCRTTAALLIRQTNTNLDLIRAQLELCIKSCTLCADECRKHAHHHEHCRICAESCEECERVCHSVLHVITS